MGSTITMCWGWCKKKAARGVQNTSNLVDVVGVVMALKLKPDLLLHFGATVWYLNTYSCQYYMAHCITYDQK